MSFAVSSSSPPDLDTLRHGLHHPELSLETEPEILLWNTLPCLSRLRVCTCRCRDGRRIHPQGCLVDIDGSSRALAFS